MGYVACWSFNNKDKTPFRLFHTTGYTFVCKQILNNKEESKPDLEKEQREEKQGSKTQASLFLHWLRRYQAEFFQPDSQWATGLARQPARQPHRLPLSQFTICLVSLSLSEPTPVCTGEALVATLLSQSPSQLLIHTHTCTHTTGENSLISACSSVLSRKTPKTKGCYPLPSSHIPCFAPQRLQSNRCKVICR